MDVLYGTLCKGCAGHSFLSFFFFSCYPILPFFDPSIRVVCCNGRPLLHINNRVCYVRVPRRNARLVISSSQPPTRSKPCLLFWLGQAQTVSWKTSTSKKASAHDRFGPCCAHPPAPDFLSK
ncbi:hypothetical protein VTI74DRAFT_586 [Chaetomium olivicolor]